MGSSLTSSSTNVAMAPLDNISYSSTMPRTGSREDPLRYLCDFILDRDLRNCKKMFKKMSWREMVARDRARDEVRRKHVDPMFWFWLSIEHRGPNGGKGVMDLPLHALLISSQTGKHDKKLYKIFKVLLKHGYDTNLIDFRGNSALHIALLRGQLYNVAVYEGKLLRKHKHYTVKFVKDLCEQGAQVNILDDQKQQSPLHLAAKYNLWSCIEILLEYGALINTQDYRGKTPLIFAIEHGCIESFTCLICNKPDLMIRTIPQATALHFAANTILSKFDSFAVRKLLHHGADPNAQDVNGNTPLHIAARTHGSTEIIVRLLRHGADASLLNKRGVTAFYEYLTNEKIFNSAIQDDLESTGTLKENVYQAIIAFLVCLPYNRPRIIRDANDRLPWILQTNMNQVFENLLDRFGTENNPESLQDQCVGKIRSCIGIQKLVDSSVTVWKLGLPKLIENIICGEHYRKALEIPIKQE